MSELPFMQEVPVGLTRLENWKQDHGVWTDNSGGCAWIAVCVPLVHERLKGYGLTEEEKADPMLLFISYFRLIDEGGMMADSDSHDDTEKGACYNLAVKLNLPWNL